MNPAQRKYICDRVCIYMCMFFLESPPTFAYLYVQVTSEFPQLKGHEKKLDGVLGKSLIQAKHYQRKKSTQVVWLYILFPSMATNLYTGDSY